MAYVILIFGTLTFLNIALTSELSDKVYENHEGVVTIDNVRLNPKTDSDNAKPDAE